jgi:hypothetical protein
MEDSILRSSNLMGLMFSIIRCQHAKWLIDSLGEKMLQNCGYFTVIETFLTFSQFIISRIW